MLYNINYITWASQRTHLSDKKTFSYGIGRLAVFDKKNFKLMFAYMLPCLYAILAFSLPESLGKPIGSIKRIFQ